MIKFTEQEDEKTISNTSTSLTKVIQMPRIKPELNITADVVLPQGEIILAKRDDTTEYDDNDNSSFNDDPQ